MSSILIEDNFASCDSVVAPVAAAFAHATASLLRRHSSRELSCVCQVRLGGETHTSTAIPTQSDQRASYTHAHARARTHPGGSTAWRTTAAAEGARGVLRRTCIQDHRAAPARGSPVAAGTNVRPLAFRTTASAAKAIITCTRDCDPVAPTMPAGSAWQRVRRRPGQPLAHRVAMPARPAVPPPPPPRARCDAQRLHTCVARGL